MHVLDRDRADLRRRAPPPNGGARRRANVGAELTAALDALGVAHADCTEKRELLERLAAASVRAHTAPHQAKGAPAPASATHRTCLPPPAPEGDEEGRVLGLQPGVLRLARDADAEAVRRAYRRLALQLHPDK